MWTHRLFSRGIGLGFFLIVSGLAISCGGVRDQYAIMCHQPAGDLNPSSELGIHTLSGSVDFQDKTDSKNLAKATITAVHVLTGRKTRAKLDTDGAFNLHLKGGKYFLLAKSEKGTIIRAEIPEVSRNLDGIRVDKGTSKTYTLNRPLVKGSPSAALDRSVPINP